MTDDQLFIPPLLTPTPSSHSRAQSAQPSPWAGPGSSLPPHFLPNSPMAQSGFIPPMAQGQPPPQAQHQQPAASNVHASFLGGFPNFSQTPYPTTPINLPGGGSPYQPAMPMGMQSPWGGMGMGMPPQAGSMGMGMPPQAGPMGTPYMGMGMGMPPQMGMGMGMGGMGGMYPPMGMPPPQPQPQPQPPWPGYPPPQAQAPPPPDPYNLAGLSSALPATSLQPSFRTLDQTGDRMGRFSPGTYGPVLSPFQLRILGVLPSLHPLLHPPSLTDSEQAHLKWNMLFSSSMCQRSSDPLHISWVDGRTEPATFPRTTEMHIVPGGRGAHHLSSLSLKVAASNPSAGVTCGDVIESLSAYLCTRTSASSFSLLSRERKEVVARSYRHNRSRNPGVPGGVLGDGLRRLDLLGEDACWGGMSEVSGMREIAGEVKGRREAGVVGAITPTAGPDRALTLPWCTYEWYNLPNYPMTEEEARGLEERQRVAEERDRDRRAHARSHSRGIDRDRGGLASDTASLASTASSATMTTSVRDRDRRRRSRATTVETVTDEDEWTDADVRSGRSSVVSGRSSRVGTRS